MLYTRKGDKGSTSVFGCDQRISKSSAIAEALGALDEINSFLGLCKVHEKAVSFPPATPEQAHTCDPSATTTVWHVGRDGGRGELSAISFSEIIHQVQQNLFIIQAELAGAGKSIEEIKIRDIEKIIDAIEKELPPIKFFLISGGTELSALFDTARAIARRAERRVAEVSEEGKVKIGAYSLAYLNRLSSLLYALARLTNHKSGINEQVPDYK